MRDTRQRQLPPGVGYSDAAAARIFEVLDRQEADLAELQDIHRRMDELAARRTP